jgi:hypothetical protein
VLLALEKGRAGEEAPAFAVRITYLQPIGRWIDKQPSRLILPALDLPVSRTGVELYHSPRFRVVLQPGTFRVESDPGIFAEALRRAQGAVGAGISGGFASGITTDSSVSSPPPPAPAGLQAPKPIGEEARSTQFQKLIDRYRNEGGGRTVAGSLPVEVAFPRLGPSLFMASELTAELKAPSIDLSIRRIK